MNNEQTSWCEPCEPLRSSFWWFYCWVWCIFLRFSSLNCWMVRINLQVRAWWLGWFQALFWVITRCEQKDLWKDRVAWRNLRFDILFGWLTVYISFLHGLENSANIPRICSLPLHLAYLFVVSVEWSCRPFLPALLLMWNTLQKLIPICSMGLGYLPTFAIHLRQSVGKYTSPMDPMG